MKKPTFHPFPRLPTELRLEIWRHAIRPFSDHRGGIQQFTVVTGKRNSKDYVIVSHGSELTRRAITVPGVSNRSAYLWDAGLLTACHESRNALHSVTITLDEQSRLREIKHLPDWQHSGQSGQPHYRHCLVLNHFGSELRGVYSPNQDLMKMNFNMKKGKAQCAERQYVWQLLDTVCEYQNYSGYEHHIGFELDAIWCGDRAFDNSSKETKVAQRVIIRLCADSLNDLIPGVKIWIIDRSSNLSLQRRRVAAEAETGLHPRNFGPVISTEKDGSATTFYDLDMEYAPVIAFRGYHGSDDYDSSASYLIYSICKMLASGIRDPLDWPDGLKDLNLGILSPRRCLSTPTTK